MALGVGSASNRNEYQESSWGWKVADNITAICELTVQKNVGALMSHDPIGIHGLL
jgi:hypothetical protein